MLSTCSQCLTSFELACTKNLAKVFRKLTIFKGELTYKTRDFPDSFAIMVCLKPGTGVSGVPFRAAPLRGSYRDRPASGENISRLCRVRILGYFGLDPPKKTAGFCLSTGKIRRWDARLGRAPLLLLS